MSETKNNAAFTATIMYGVIAFIIFFMLVIFSFTYDFVEVDTNDNITNLEDTIKSDDQMRIISVFVQLLIGLSIAYAGLMIYFKDNPKGLS